MKLLRRGLLILTVVALVVPAPVVGAQEVEPGLDEELTEEVLALPESDLSVAEVDEGSNFQVPEVMDEVIVDEVEDAPQAVSSLVLDSDNLELIEPKKDNEGTEDNEDDDPDSSVAIAGGVVITELQTRGSAGATSELVEVFNASHQDIDITGWCIQRASSKGSYTNMSCVEPSDGLAQTRVIWRARSYLLLISGALKDTASSGLKYDLTFSAGMSDDGGRIRVVDSNKNVIDMIGWGNAGESKIAPAPKITSSLPLKSLQRIVVDGEYQNLENNSLDFHLDIASTEFSSGAISELTDYCINIPGIQLVVPGDLWRLKNGNCVDIQSINLCSSFRLNEVAANSNKQFIELKNIDNNDASLAGCVLMTNRSTSSIHALPEVLVRPGGLFVVDISDTDLKLTKSTSGTVYLLASDGETEVDEVYYEDLSSETSWALIGDEWQQTYGVSPGQDNYYLEYPSCQEGYFRNNTTGRCNKIVELAVLADCGEGRERNPLTGRCRNIPALAILAPCREGQYRSEETNRCRSIASVVSSLKPCADDQFRNPATNRCKKIAADSDVLKECAEGFERNPATNRCRKVLNATAPTVPFAPEKIEQVAGGTLGWWAFGGLSLIAIGYAVWQWRFEIGRLIRRLAGVFSSAGK